MDDELIEVMASEIARGVRRYFTDSKTGFTVDDGLRIIGRKHIKAPGGYRLPLTPRRKAAYARRYYQLNRSRILARAKVIWRRDYERLRLKQREYRKQHREEILARTKLYRRTTWAEQIKTYESRPERVARKKENRKLYRTRCRLLLGFSRNGMCADCQEKLKARFKEN